jgi:outer membrane lipoprotein SlyB
MRRRSIVFSVVIQLALAGCVSSNPSYCATQRSAAKAMRERSLASIWRSLRRIFPRRGAIWRLWTLRPHRLM